ncbi:MAG: iron-sulfur cluster assembly accessory protein [Lysobacterales bacterium]
MAITLSPAARERVRTFLEQRDDALGLRLGVKRSGCSGWSYVADVASATSPDDFRFNDEGIEVFVDAEAMILLDGMHVDLERDGLNSRFVFRNPNVTAECGCGTSFTTSAEHA